MHFYMLRRKKFDKNRNFSTKSANFRQDSISSKKDFLKFQKNGKSTDIFEFQEVSSSDLL